MEFACKCTNAIPFGMAFVFKNYAGDHLISHTVARAVPSAQRGLTSVFEMGTGDPSQYGHRQIVRGMSERPFALRAQDFG